MTGALRDLEAEAIVVPPFEKNYLDRGHSIHFSCRRADVEPMRLDVMSKMRGVLLSHLYGKGGTTASISGMGDLDIMSLPDLVAAKKTQRDKGLADGATPRRGELFCFPG